MQTENSVISDELYVSYKLGLEKELEINRQNTADWTTEVPTEEGFYAVYFANKDTNKRAVAHVAFNRGEFVITLVYENDKHACWFLKDWSGDSSPTHWFRIPTPPLPGKEGM